jgi:hypothetical protein
MADGFQIEITFNGVDRPLQVQPDEAMQSVLSRALALFGLQSPVHTMGLFTESNIQVAGRRPDGQDLPNQSVEKTGIKPGQILVLRQTIVQGG